MKKRFFYLLLALSLVTGLMVAMAGTAAAQPSGPDLEAGELVDVVLDGDPIDVAQRFVGDQAAVELPEEVCRDISELPQGTTGFITLFFDLC
jgi:hypothetical protein